MPSNDNDPPVPPPAADAHGQAALLLVESLIHGLCEQSTLTVDQAVDIVETAVSVQFDVAGAAGEGSAQKWQSHALLTSIARSLMIDANEDRPLPHLVS